MYHIAWRCATRSVAQALHKGVSYPTRLASVKGNTLGLHLGQFGAPLHTCSSVRLRPCWRPLSALVLPATTPHNTRQPGALLLSRVAAISSLTTASELSAAIAAAPSAAALQGLAASAANTPHQAWLVQQYKVQLLPRLEEESPASLVKSLWFFARLGPGHAEMFERAVPVLYNQLGQLTPRDLLDLLTAYAGAAASHTPSAYSHELFAALTEFLWEGLGGLEPGGLAAIAEGYAAVGHFDDDEDFFGGVAAAALHKLEAFCPEDLSRLMSGLAQLRFATPELSTAALAQMSAQLDAWPLSCIGRLLRALATVQAAVDPCVLERVGSHVSNCLRNLRTSTDGKQLLASLSNQGRVVSNGAGGGVAGGVDGVVSSSSGGGATLPGLAGSSGSSSTGANTRISPSWQGFGMSRSSSSSSAGAAADGDGTSTSSSSSSSTAAPPTPSQQDDHAASLWAAANSSSSIYEYTCDPPPAGTQQQPPLPASGVTHVLDQECELGPDYITVTSYSPDGHITTTYIKKAAAGSSLGLDNIGRGGGLGAGAGAGGSSSSGPKPPPGTRAIATSSRGWQPLGSRAGTGLLSGSSSSTNGNGNGDDEGCPASWQWQTISTDCRPVYDDAPALQGAIVDTLWSFAMLGHIHATMAKECFKALALVQPEALGDGQLGMLWACHMRYQQLGHVMLDPNPLLAESYSTFVKEVSRAAPRTLSLPASLQPLAAGQWLLQSIRASPEYQGTHHQHYGQHSSQHQQLGQPHSQQQQQYQDGSQQQQQQQVSQQQPALMSWKYRDPSVLTQQGLEASVRQALQQLGLPVGSPCVTLDGLERVGLPLKHNGVCIAWQVLPPALCTRNPPHSPTAEAQARRWALQYRGYTVLQVPFHEWASVLESGDDMVRAGYLQSLLDSVASVRAPHVPNF